MLKLTVVRGPTSAGKSFNLRTGVVIGRGEDCDVRLGSPGVSKQHCRVSPMGGSKAEIEDLGSSNGTFVNGLMVKKHVLRIGDTVSLHQYVLQLELAAPEIAETPAFGGGFGAGELHMEGEGGGTIDGQARPATFSIPSSGAPSASWLESNVYPWADRLSGRFDVRFLLGGFFLFWTILVVALTASPFATKANEKIREESIQTAKLYARQLARVNQQAIVEQRYRDLVSQLDARVGQTAGVVQSMILDATKGIILAPADHIGSQLPNSYAVRAISKEEEFVDYDKNTGLAYVSAPIKVGMEKDEDGKRVIGNVTVATALVVFDSDSAQIKLAALIDQMLNSVLIATLISLLFLIFIYRWIDGSIGVAAASVDAAMQNSQTTVASPVKWPALASLMEQVSFALGRGAGATSQSSPAGNGAWAIAAAQTSGEAAAAFDPNLTVLAWNPGMEQIIGIRATMAVGSNLSSASRDVAFESTVRELAGQASATQWAAVEGTIEFSGNPYRIAATAGDGALLVTITRKDS